MEKVLQIQTTQIDAFVNRELKRQLDVIKIVFGCVLVLFVIIGVIAKAAFFPFVALAVFGVVFLYVSAILKGDLRALSTAFTFTIDDNRISRQVDWSKINSFMKLRAERARHRYGSSLEQEIALAHVAEIAVGVNGMKVTSINANILNGNGIINLPVEIAAYGEILDYFKSSPALQSKVVEK